jgi:hypothetical protein
MSHICLHLFISLPSQRSVTLLADRLSQSLGLSCENSKAAKKPFKSVSVVPDSSQQLPVTGQQHQQSFVNSGVQHGGSPVQHVREIYNCFVGSDIDKTFSVNTECGTAVL